MKSISLIIIALTSSFYIHANIINGYEKDLKKAEAAVHNLSNLLDRALSSDNDEQFHNVKSHYLRAKRALKHATTYYLVTEELTNQLRKLHGSYYHELNTIRNHHGSITDVYIRVMPESLMEHNQFGTTNVDQLADDPHTYQSSFGPNTVSVLIRQCSLRKMTSLLVHELAHVKYQVPNLLSYLNYYRETYLDDPETASLGHGKGDPSHESVIKELAAFRKAGRKKPDNGLASAELTAALASD